MNSLTTTQKVSFLVAVFSFLAAGGSTADLVTLFGTSGAKYIVSVASLLAGIGGLFLAMVTGATGQIKAVVAMAQDPTSPVQGIITTADQQGKELAASIPGPIVAAGSDKATDIAKS